MTTASPQAVLVILSGRRWSQASPWCLVTEVSPGTLSPELGFHMHSRTLTSTSLYTHMHMCKHTSHTERKAWSDVTFNSPASPGDFLFVANMVPFAFYLERPLWYIYIAVCLMDHPSMVSCEIQMNTELNHCGVTGFYQHLPPYVVQEPLKPDLLIGTFASLPPSFQKSYV